MGLFDCQIGWRDSGFWGGGNTGLRLRLRLDSGNAWATLLIRVDHLHLHLHIQYGDVNHNRLNHPFPNGNQ